MVLSKVLFKPHLITAIYLFFFMSGLLSAAELKTMIAVFGYEPLANILTVKLSENDSVSVFERNQISAILKEHKINGRLITRTQFGKHFPHADLFMIISSAGDINREYPSGITVFNAKNGAQLVNSPLPKELDAATAEAMKAVLCAIKKFNNEKLCAISISAVRDVGVPKESRYSIARITTLIERELVASPEIQVLERTHLERVLQERKITEIEHPIDPSSFLIRLEFTPDPNRKTADLKVSLTDAERKELFAYEIKDCFMSQERTAADAVKNICGFLKVTPVSAALDSKKEAARFYAEYQNLTANGVTKKDASSYLFASLALNRLEFESRRAEIFYYAEFLGNMTWDERIPALWEALDNMKFFMKDFSDAHTHGGNLVHTAIGDSKFMKNRNSATPEQRKQLAEYADAYRAFHFETCGKCYNFNLNDGIQSLEEAKQYCSFVWHHQDYYLFCDPSGWYRKRSAMTLDALKRADQFAKEHPESKKELEQYILNECQLFTRLFLSRYDGEFDSDPKVAAEYFSDFREFKEFAGYSAFSSAKVFAAQADCMKQILQSDRSEAEVNKILIDFFEKIYQMEPGFMDRRDLDDKSYKFSTGYLIDFLRNVANCLKKDTMIKTVIKVQADHNVQNDFDKMFYILYGLKENDDQGMLGKIREIMPQIKKYSYFRASSTDVFLAYNNLYAYLTFRYSNKAEADSCLADLNSGFEIRTTPIATGNNASSMRVTSCADGEGTEYILMTDQSVFRIYSVDLNSDTLCAKELVELPVKFPEEKRNITFSASGGYVLVFINGKALICNTQNKNVKVIDIQDSKIICNMACVNGRVYIITGPDRDSSAPRSLISMLPDGSDVRTHFSSLRDTKIAELDNLDAGVFSSIVPLSDGKRFLFAVSDVKGARPNTQQRMFCYNYGNPLSGLYIFDTTNGECKLLHKLPLSIDVRMKRTAGKISMLACGFGRQFYEISEPDLNLNFMITRNKEDKNLFEAGKVRYYLESTTNYPIDWPLFPFLIKDDYLWNSGPFGNHYAGIFCINLKNEKETPFLLIPYSRGLFVWKDYVVFIHDNVMDAVKLKKKTPADAK